MGSSIAADSKMMYYPTQEIETHRLLGLLGRITIDSYKREMLKNLVIGQEKYRELFCISADNNIVFDHVLYNYLLEQKNYKAIKEFCNIEFNYKNQDNVVIADLFAGQGVWLSSFKSIMDKSNNCNDFITVANELDEDRFTDIQNNPNIDDCYNKSFEELQLPKNCISLMLFNPPYGNTMGTRNVRHYLNMIINRKLIYNPEQSKDYKTGYIVFVIRKDDFLDSLDLIVRHFDINKSCIYKVNPEEYAKFKQYIFIGHIRKNAYNTDNIQDVADFQNQYNTIQDIINSEPEFELRMYNTYQWMNYPYIDYSTAKENFRYADNQNKYISHNDGAWKWIKGITELKNLSSEKITMPKNCKLGEVAMLLASGKINGNINLDNNRASHIVVGGTKTIQTQETETHKDIDGKNVHTTKTIKMSKPYLNILCTQNGKLIIKELGEADIN